MLQSYNIYTRQAVSEFHWYVSAYHLSFEDFGMGGKVGPLCKDEPASASMFRVVFKSNLTTVLAEDLFARICEVMDHVKEIKAENTSKKAGDIISIRRAIEKRVSEKMDTVLNKATKTFANAHKAC